jgi:hypothetical protein
MSKQTKINSIQLIVLRQLEERVANMISNDKETGEHKDASPLDYVRWAIEEIEENHHYHNQP